MLLFSIIAILCNFAYVSNQSTEDSVEILAVSTMLNLDNSQRSGSTEGGTTIYIRATGLDPVPTNNVVKIGPYSCYIPDKGVNGQYLTCDTLKPDPTKSNTNLQVTVQPDGKPVSTCASGVRCQYSFTDGATPQIQQLLSKTTYPRDIMEWKGKFVNTHIDDIKDMWIGDLRCDRFDIITEVDEINGNQDYVQCQVSRIQEAGMYEVKARTVSGNAKRSPSVNYVSVTQEESDGDLLGYNVRVMPWIEQLSNNFVSTEGQILRISGLGFSKNKDNNRVTIGKESVVAEVLKASLTELEVLVPALDADYDTNFWHILGGGLKYTRYDLEGSGIGSSCTNLRDSIRDTPDDMVIVEERIVGEPETEDRYGVNYGQYYRGYLKAPRNGEYRFLVYSDDCSEIYVNSVKNTQDPATMVEVAFLTAWSQGQSYYKKETLDNAQKQRSDPITLEAGEYYYVEMYMINNGGPGYFSVALEIPPNSDPSKQVDKAVEIQKIEITSTPVREILKYKVYNKQQNSVLGGTYKLRFAIENTRDQIKITDEIPATASESQLQNKIQGAGAGYKCSVTRQKLDSSGNPTEAVDFAGYEYTVTFTQLRNTDPAKRVLPTLTEQRFTDGQVNTVSITRTQDPSPHNSGTYQLSWGGYDLEYEAGNKNFPFNANPNSIRNALRSLQSGDVAILPEVDAWRNGDCNEECQIYIKFDGYSGLLSGPERISVPGNNLQGPNVAIAASVYMAGSDNQMLKPIPGELFYQPASVPSVQVTTNGIMAVCSSDCSYEAISSSDTPTMTAFSYNYGTNQLTITLTDPRVTVYTADDLSIQFAGVECGSVSVSSPSTVTCTTNGALEAGLHLPIVDIAGVGFPIIDAGVTAEDIALTITNVSPTTGSIGGGTTVTITGSGFPNSVESSMVLTVKGNSVTPVSVSNTQIVLLTPPNSIDEVGTIVIEFNSKTATSGAFSYSVASTVTVTKLTSDEAGSVAVTSTSPWVRQDYYVHGTNFGTDRAQVKVELVNRNTDKVYNLYIADPADVTDTRIKVRISGGRSGEYDIRVTRDGWGSNQDTANDDFQFKIAVTSATPNVGSDAGGTLLTINGYNFVPGEMTVFIGEGVNWMCTIISETTTQIQCLTPEKNDDVAYDSPVSIHVTVKLREESVTECDPGADCQFQYLASSTPYQYLPDTASEEENIPDTQAYEPVHHSRRLLTHFHRRNLFKEHTMNLDHNHIAHFFNKRRNLITLLAQDKTVPRHYVIYKPGDTVTISGSGFGTNPTVQIGDYAELSGGDLTTKTDTQIVFEFPKGVPSGNHRLIVIHDAKGYAEGVWYARVQLAFAEVEPITPVEGSKAGQLITLKGQGFNFQDSDEYKRRPAPRVTVGDIECRKVTVVDYETITCVTPVFDARGGKRVKIIQADPFDKFKTQTVQGPLFAARDNATPVVTSVSQVDFTNPNSVSFTVTGTNFKDVARVVKLIAADQEVVGTSASSAGATIDVTFSASVPIGIYDLEVSFDDGTDVAYASTNLQIQVTTTGVTANAITSSVLGGALLTINGAGLSDQANVKVCGFDCQNVQTVVGGITCSTPAFLSEQAQTDYSVQPNAESVDLSEFTITGDVADADYSLVVDGLQKTKYVSTVDPLSEVETCYFDVDFGDVKRLKLKVLRFLPSLDILADIMIGSKFEYSTDGSTFTDLLVLDSSVHSDWNSRVFESPIVGIKHLRFSGLAQSQCSMAEVQVDGWLQYHQDPALATGVRCDVEVSQNEVAVPSLSQKVEYKSSYTPVVTDIDTLYGPTIGGTQLTITGTGFAGTPLVTIDTVTCAIDSSTSTQIVCTTGNRDTVVGDTNIDRSLEIRIDGQLADIQCDWFLYANAWSDVATWGGDAPPIDGDTIIVPRGQVLLVDIDVSPKLFAIFVEGGLIFADGQDQQFYANFILVRMGTLTIGTEDKRRQNKLVIELSGNIFEKQLPEFGNKFIGCHMCTLDIHGQYIERTWSMMTATADVGATSVNLMHELNDWKVGDEIVIASTDWNHIHAEQRTITDITPNAGTGETLITFAEPLRYKHYSEVESYNGEDFPMRCEVGLLSRNVVIQGNAEDTTDETQYGAHLMFHGQTGNGRLVGRISYAEFRRVGQPQILGRYPIHFHMNGEVYDSYAIGNAIHDSYARCVTIHGVHYLTVNKNVCYNAMGHAIFLEDGIETNNVFIDNFVLGNKQSWIMLQTDITVASYWFTNPYNTVRDNHCGGSEWYGFWYEIKVNPDGPSATSDICPPGMELLEFKNNVCHSNGRFGLRILEMSARQKPCHHTRQDRYYGKYNDPFEANPAIELVFQNFTTFKNNEDGVLAEFMGYATFRDFKVADSKLAAFQSHKCNLTKEGTTLENWLIVGVSQNNPNPDEYYVGTNAIIAPRTNGLHVKNVRIHNFIADMILFQSCSVCFTPKLWVVGGKNTDFENIQFFNTDQAKKLFWEGHRREIFWDLDGSISGSPAYIIPFKNHLKGLCREETSEQWDNSMICDMASVTIRDFFLNNPQPERDFSGLDMRVFRMGMPGEDLTSVLEDAFTQEWMIKIKKSKDLKNSFATPLATGFTYNVHWRMGLNWEHLAVQPSQFFTEADKGYVIKFNYTDNREYFDILRLQGGSISFNYSEPKMLSSPPDPDTCENGQWFNDQTNEDFYICFSGKDKTPFEYVDVNAVRCRRFCPDPFAEEEKETFFRYWSDTANWIYLRDERPEYGLTQLGADNLPDGTQPIVIPYAWNLYLDVDPPLLQNLTILGDVYFTTDKDHHLKAKVIWIRYGKLIAGSNENPWPKDKKITIELVGEFDDPYLLIDPYIEASNKVLAVTGSLEMYGQPPETVWTRLSQYADAGTSVIHVLEATDWKVGDEIVLGPSGRNPDQYEKRTITAIDNLQITLDTALEFDHYGAETETIVTEWDTKLDMRAGVGLLTRNIKIKGNNEDSNGWGCHVLIYQYTETRVDELGTEQSKTRRGWTDLKGVEFENCGQYDTQKAGLNFQWLNDDEVPGKRGSNVIGSSFHESSGFLFNCEDSTDVIVDNNVFFKGQKALVQMINSKRVAFTNNLLIFVKKREGMAQIGIHDWAALGHFAGTEKDPDVRKANIHIAHNTGQGSQDSGFYFFANPCNEPNFGIYDNTVSSTVLAGHAFKEINAACARITQMYAFHTARGIMAAMNIKRTDIDQVIMAENSKSIVIKPGISSNYDNPQHHRRWYISGLARPDCPKCYNKEMFGSICKNQLAYQLYTSSSSAFPPLSSKPSTAFDTICTIQKIDGRAYIKDVSIIGYNFFKSIFHNLRLDYSDLGAGFEACGNNIGMTQHGGSSDMTASHYFTNVQAVDSDTNALFKFKNPSPGGLGWFGGCGSFLCTGKINIIIEDTDGKFLNTEGPTQVFPNNTYIGPNMTTECTRVEKWNGYHCTGTTFAVLNWQSLAPDYNKRLFSPVSIFNDKFYNEINTLKEWAWDGPEPLNKRESRFIGIVQRNTVLNMTNAGQNPSDAEYWIQERTPEGGNPDDWIILKMRYFTPHALQVLKRKSASDEYEIIKPFLQRFNAETNEYVWEDLELHTSECGANNYYSENNTIHFVVTGEDCMVRVRQINSVFVTARLEVAYDTFFQGNPDDFLERVIAFLDIDFSQIKIVGHKSGSTILDMSIEDDEAVGMGEDYDADAKQEALVGLAYQFKEGLESDQISGYTGTIREEDIKPLVVKDMDQWESSETIPDQTFEEITKKKKDEKEAEGESSGGGGSDNSSTVGIAVGVTVACVVIIAIIVGVVIWKKKKSKENQVQKVAQDDSQFQNQSKDKVNNTELEKSDAKLKK